MENKVIWKIRYKESGEFMKLGYRGKTSWGSKPTQAIKENLETRYLGYFELVKFQYKLVEETTEEIKL